MTEPKRLVSGAVYTAEQCRLSGGQHKRPRNVIVCKTQDA